ncbi:MAG TPA: pilus assembly protein TadG-related protein [Candidatus Limnocylindria bacterium]|nr:pilus assembly protein TadG-related protein [Candidatus Limnocylindria bacterium]
MRVGRVPFVRQDSGQTVVLVALMFTVLMGFAALGIDVGRFYSERRYVQDAVDAAALACARAYAGGDATAAWNAADRLLQDRNLLNNPLGITLTYAARNSEVYDNGVVNPLNLNSGILPVQTSGRGCRVAITVAVPTFLIKIVSPTLNTISMTTRGYAKSYAGFYPSVVHRYANPPGPGNGNTNQFIDHVMAEGQDYQCTVTNPGACTIADTVNKGREFVIFGQAAKATNDSSFRGYIALDIRDFTTVDGSGNLIHEQTSPGIAYNQVPSTATVNTLKDLEAAWILEPGYPGPDICVVQPGNFLPCAQIAVINGSSSGLFVDDYESRFNIGDRLLLQLYDGTVKTVPDFAMSTGTLNLPNSGTATSTISYTFSPQFAASGAQVTTTVIPDDGTMTDDGGGTASVNPFLNGCATFSSPVFSANPTLSGVSTYNQTWNTITTSGCDKGIFQAWVRGTSSAPYTSRVHEALVNINVGGQARDFSLTSSDTYAAIAAPGTQANFVIRTTTSAGGATKWTGNNLLTLSWAKCPTSTDPAILPPEVLTCGIDGVMSLPGVLPPPVTNMDPGEDHTFNVQTTLARTGEVYKGWVRETGLDDVTNKRVTHLIELTLEVGIVAGGATQYADVLGYTVFEITAINSNDVSGRAITGAYTDPNDPALAIGRKWRLVPWETP